MSRETKSNGQKDELDRFYTPYDIAQRCINEINLSEYDCIIEPSAGIGSFSNLIDGCFAFDISPGNKNIIKADWLSLDKSQFSKYDNILVIGNPPFGIQNRLAISFFNESAKFSNTIAFILPKSFRKNSIQNKLDMSFSLIKDMNIDRCDFLLPSGQIYQVPCTFQIWKREGKRKPIRLKTTSNLFSFTTKDNADFRIQRVGGNAGKASFNLNVSNQSNYFIKNNTTLSNKDFVNIINSLFFPSIENTVGPKSLSKGELVSVIENILNGGDANDNE